MATGIRKESKINSLESFDFSPESSYLYFAENMNGSQKIKRHLIDNFNGNVTKLADGGGQVRRSRNGCIYVTKAGSKNQYIITAPDEATPTVTLTQTMTDANFSYDRPMMNQPVSIYTKEENLFTREAGEKHYELADHLGNVRVVISDVKLNRDTAGGPNSFIADVKAVYNYLPFGFPTPGRNYFGASTYRWGFNGQEKDDEITGVTGSHYTAEFWEYDSRIGRRWNLDPVLQEWESPYLCFSGNPILNVDPNGDLNREYKVNANTGVVEEVSDMGGDAVDIIHYEGGEYDGKTEIFNNNTGDSQFMSSFKNIKDYNRRDNNTNWASLYAEYKKGIGPEKSLIYQNHPMNAELMASPTFIEAMQEFVASNEKKYRTEPFFNPISAGTNMTAQFMGKANYSFYEVGDKIVIVVMDSKSITSETLNPVIKNIESVNKSRESGKVVPESTTHQTYLFILPTTIKKQYEK